MSITIPAPITKIILNSSVSIVLCMITVLIVYPVVSLADMNKNMNVGSLTQKLDVSYYLEVGAAVLAIGALVTCHFMKHKK